MEEWQRQDSFNAWLYALELARDGHSGLREFFSRPLDSGETRSSGIEQTSLHGGAT